MRHQYAIIPTHLSHLHTSDNTVNQNQWKDYLHVFFCTDLWHDCKYSTWSVLTSYHETSHRIWLYTYHMVASPNTFNNCGKWKPLSSPCVLRPLPVLIVQSNRLEPVEIRWIFFAPPDPSDNPRQSRLYCPHLYSLPSFTPTLVSGGIPATTVQPLLATYSTLLRVMCNRAVRRTAVEVEDAWRLEQNH